MFKYDSRYNTYSLSVVLYLLHNSEEYSKIWLDKYQTISDPISNFFKNEECGCRPVLIQNYHRYRFDIDFFTVKFINDNPEVVNFDKLCSEVGGQDLRGTIFSINNTVSDFKDFLSSVQQKKASFNYFNTVTIQDKILISFF